MTDAYGLVLRDIRKERAETMGRSGVRLEQALDALRAFDRDAAAMKCTAALDKARERLLLAAAERLCELLVQREAWGLRDPKPALEVYDVPREVVAKVGVRAKA